jgi:hypothetical protein
MRTRGDLLDLYNRLETAGEVARLKRRALTRARPTKPDEDHWEPWLRILFARYLCDHLGRSLPFADHHARFWEWVWQLERGVRPPPFTAIWPRGGAKSTSAEMAVCAIAARRQRKYCLYIAETQDQADDHVSNIGAMLESVGFGLAYPETADRAMGKYGNVRGWRRNRLHTRSGFVIDAMGLDTSARGAKIDEDRPDLFVLDDLDGELDSPGVVQRKIETLTRKLLPAGAPDLAVIAIQNLVHPDSIFARLADGRADFLADRIISGPYPALLDAAYEQRNGKWMIVAGTPTWEGQNLSRCQDLLDTIGYSSFKSECQHEVDAPPGGMYDHVEFRHCDRDELPDLVRVVCWVDPAVTDNDGSDANGIEIDGIGAGEQQLATIYRLFSEEEQSSPLATLKRAIVKALEYKAECVGVETDQGGETWESVYVRALEELLAEGSIERDPNAWKAGVLQPAPWVQLPVFRFDKAGAGHGPKAHRQAQVLADYEMGRIVHVLGTHAILERALKRFPRTKPLDLADAGYWSWKDLRGGAGRAANPVAGGERPLIAQYGDLLGMNGGNGNGYDPRSIR